MYPTILGFIDSYTFMIILGIIACFIVLAFYFKKNKISKECILDLLICASAAIICGIIFAILFQNLYNLIEYKQAYKWTWAMTFTGGLFGGVLGFLIVYFLYYKKLHDGAMKYLLVIAPGAITIAHCLGRIGCFLAGCCYGVKTNSWIDVNFPELGKRVPTQLIEAIILGILTIVLLLLAFKKEFKYNFPIYLLVYGIARFIIEFYRDDHRGAFLGIFSPSQIWSIAFVIGSVVLFILEKKIIFKNEN